MRRVAPLVLVAAAVWWVWPRPVAPLPPARSVEAPARVVPAETSSPAAVTTVPARTWMTSVSDACDLDLASRCEGEICAAVVTMPDMDRITGWLGLLARSPRFVLSTAARDLGLPAGGLPCGVAVDGRVALALELDDGTEVWCSFDGDEARGRALCRALAEPRIGALAVQFEDPDLRRLSFR